jgi:subtilisin-like proprotein convertase family protein
MVRKGMLNATLLLGVATLLVALGQTEGAPELLFEILGRPQGVRPIPGETVQLTCTVDQATALTWRNSNFTNDLIFLNVHDVDSELIDPDTNAVAVLTNKTGGNLTSVLRFYSVQGNVHNNTVVECIDNFNEESTNVKIVMAGIPSPPVEPEHSNNTCTCANITWITPEYDGAAAITNFTITLTLPAHTLPNSSVSTERVEIAPANATGIDVCDLHPNAVYNTTITSHNDVGSSRAEEFVIVIYAIEPYPAQNVVVRPVCANHRQCLFNDADYLSVTWELPPLNSYLLCPVEQTWLNYSYVELEVDMESFQITSPNISVMDTSFEIRPVMPGTTYNVTVSFVNEVGESLNNTVVVEDVLLFQNYLLQKQVAPFSVAEGQSAVYTVKLDGPPPNDVAITVNEADNFISVTEPLQFEALVFNADNWFVAQEIVVNAIDDDIILESPYGSLLRVVDIGEMMDVNITLLVSEMDIADVVIISRETYPSFRHIPEGRWSVYNVTLPNRPYHNVTITFHPLTPTITLSHVEMTFEPDNWDVPQILTVYATEDNTNIISPYMASFNMSLTSLDENYDGAEIDDFNVTVEDNDDDTAVLTGSLTWVKVDGESRTTARLLLTLTLSHSQYPEASEGDSVHVSGAQVEFGDGETGGDTLLPMQVMSVQSGEGYILVSTSLLHTYPTASSDGQPWEAVFEYCCRGQTLRNNQETRIRLSVGVDLSYTSSPLTPSLPPITLHNSQGIQGFFYTSSHPNSHPLTYSLGGMFDYMSSQAGTPQGVKISHSTGHVTCDTDHMTPGDYSVMIVVEDTISGIRTVSELIIRVKSPVDNVPPFVLLPHPLLPPPPLIFTPNNTRHTFSLYDADTVMGLELQTFSGFPEGAELSELSIKGANSGDVLLSWTPAEEQTGVYIACFVAMDMHSTPSTPYCLPLIASAENMELPILDCNGPLENDSTYSQHYTKGIDQDAALVANDAIISLSSYGIHYMSIAIANSPDGSSEKITFADSFQPSISYHYTQPPSDDHSSVLVIEGTATPAVYTNILRHLRYTNSKGRPTVDERVVYVTISDGEVANNYVLSYITVDVSIHNIAPLVSVSGSDESFETLFFPFEGPVPALSPVDTYVVDTDSAGIEEATLQLNNVQDGEYEILSVTYKSPERLSLPVIAEAVDLDIPFGVLWDGEEAPSISSTITVEGKDTLAVVGEVSVVIDVKHSWVGDLRIELKHNSLRKLLVLNPGGPTCQNDDLFRTTFSSYYNSQTNAPHLSTTPDSPGVCVLRSQGVFTTDGDIDFFHGMSIDGEWVLYLMDDIPDEHSGRLVGWSLLIQPLETHLVESYPPVLPPLRVSGETDFEETHTKEVTSDGRIVTIAVHIHLGVPHTAEYAFLPSLTLVHPDGTEVVLAHGIDNLCTIGNYTHIVFDDRAQSNDYTCHSHIESQSSGSSSGSGLGSIPEELGSSVFGSGSDTASSSGSDTASSSGFDFSSSSGLDISSSSGSDIGSNMGSASNFGSGSGWLLLPENTITFDDAIAMNITTFPRKWSLIDILRPTTALRHLKGKRIEGEWKLVMTSDHSHESTLYDWSLKIAREPNIDAVYDLSQNLLTLAGLDSPENYQSVLKSVVYENTAPNYEFLTTRRVDTTVSDGELYSDTTANASKSYITLHHIVLDLDPAQLSLATAPDFSIRFIEHGKSIAILDPKRAILTDETFPVGLYTLVVTLKDYQNYNKERITVDTTVSPELQAVLDNDIINGEFIITITSVNSTLQPIELFQSVMRTVEYQNYAEEFVGSSRSVEFVATDTANGSLFTSRVATAHITLNPTNDVPVLQLNSYQYGVGSVFSNVVEYEEGEGVVLLANASAVVLTDNDHDTLERVTITIENAQDGPMEILYANTTGYGITYEYNSTANVLILNGTESLESYAKVIGTVMYSNTFHSPGMPGTDPRYISFVPYDGTHDGHTATALVTFSAINDAPFGDLNGLSAGVNFTTTFTEERGPVNITSDSLTLFDIDNVTLAYITVQITNARDGSLESLSVMDIVEQTDPKAKNVVFTFLRPETFYDDSTATLTISELDSVREYQEVLKTLTYSNTADEPDPSTRLVKVIMSDGKSESSPLYIFVDIELVNDSPYFDHTQSPFEPEMQEDLPPEVNRGIPISAIAYLIIDDDVGARKGIAITELDTKNGEWEFTLNNGESWMQIHPVNESAALVLEAEHEQRVRFLPNQDFNGDVDIVIVAWDESNDEITAGSYANAVSQSNIDPFSSESLRIALTVIPVNDAPVLFDIPLNATSILEDNYNSTGDTVLSLLAYASDVDSDEELGIAVIAADQEHGDWQYTTDGGYTWEWFGSINVESALLLRSMPVDDNRVRFVPDVNFNGYVSLEFVVWDLTRFSEHVIDEAVLLGSALTSGEITITSGSGSDSLFSGSGSLFSGSGSGLSGSSSGSLSSGSGSASGSTYHLSGSGMDSSGLGSLSPNVSLPEPYPVGSYVNTSISDEVTGPFSVNSTSFTVWVEPVNDSPVIKPGMTLHDIIEDIGEEMNHGTQVSSIINGYYEDVDANPDMGLAVIEVDNRFGVWQYTCDSPLNPSSWEPFIGDRQYNTIVPLLPLQEKATLLLSTCWIRFLPVPNFNNALNYKGYPRPETDSPYITALGWDNTGSTANRSGTHGNDGSYASESITNEYSMDSEKIFITIISSNDRPVLGLTNATVKTYTAVFLEDLYPVYITGEGLSLIDVDHARLRDVTVTIYGSVYDTLPPSLANIDFGVSVSGDYSSGDGSSSTSGSTSASGSASASGSGSSSGSGFGTDFDSEPEMVYPPFIPMVTSAPDLPPLHRVREFVENLSEPTVLERYCAGLEPRREELFIDVSKWDLQYSILSWCPFTLYIYADPRFGNDAPKNQFALALRTLQYNNSIDEPEEGNRTVTFVVSDNFNVSDPVSATVIVVSIDDSPILNLNENIPSFNNFVAYTEGQGPLLLANESLSLMDHDDTYLQGARIVLINAPDEDREVLDADTSNTNITSQYVNYTLILTGNDTIDVYREVLATVTYSNVYANPGNPAQIERRVYFYVSDGEMESDPAIAIISFTAVNNRPHLFVNGLSFDNFSVVFTEEQGPVHIVAPDLLLHDEDNTSVAFITARIVNNEEGPAEHLFADNNPLVMMVTGENNTFIVVNLFPNITYTAETAELYISGLDSIEEYEHVLRTIQYDNTADEPNTNSRIIEFIANDGLLDSQPVYTVVSISLENDSPRFNDSVSIISAMILEDEYDNEGISIFEFAYFLIEDDDMDYDRGVAVIGVDAKNGVWQFMTATEEWTTIPDNINITEALLLRGDLNMDNAIRFVPNLDFNGNASVTFLPWDATDDLEDGTPRVAISDSDLDSLGQETMDFVVHVIPVNDAPVQYTPTVEPQMTTIREDDVWERESNGDDIALFLSALNYDVDVENINSTHFGIAIIGVDSSNGDWEVSVNGGVNWTSVGTPSPSSAVVMHSQPVGENRIRFVPERDYNGRSSFQYLLWDMNVTWPSGTQGVDTTTQDAVTGTFSVASTTAHIEIEPVNDSPVLTENGGLKLNRIAEDLNPSLNFGTRVSIILTSHFSDIDGLAVGLAVVHVDERNGRWWYTCQTGTNIEWNEFIGGYINYETEEGTVSQVTPQKPNEFAATLLGADCSIRFLPDANFNTEYNLDGSPRDPADTPYITVRGWDQTQGDILDITVNTSTTPDNHTNAFSAEIFQATIEVVHGTDAPVLRLDGDNENYQVTYVEAVPPERVIMPVFIVNSTHLRLTDSDNATLSSAIVSFSPVASDLGYENLLVDVSGTSLTAVAEPDVYSLTIEPSGNAQTAPIEDFETVLKTVRYQNTAEEPSTDTRFIHFIVNDGLTISTPRTTRLSIQLTNDPPELDLNIGLSDSYTIVGYSEGEGAANLLNPVTVALVDHDNATLDHARVNITNPYDMRYEVLAVDLTSTNITATLNDSLLLLQGPASVDEFKDVIASITYENTFAEPGNPSGLNRTIEFVVNDGLDDGIPAFVYLLFTVVNNAPFLDLNGGLSGNDYNTAFYEEQGAVSAVSQELSILDIDNGTLAYIEVKISNPRDGSEYELLWVEDVTVTIPPETETRHITYVDYRPIQYYNVTTATLTITGLETVKEYQEVLKTLKYDNTADEPNSETRELHITVSDGLLDTTAISFVDIVNINDSPYFNDSATLFSSHILEDVHNLHNAGWAVEDIVAGLILDDDADSQEGIAIIAAETANGHWEITWNYRDLSDPLVPESGSGSASGILIEPSSGDGSSSGSGLLPFGSGSAGSTSGSGSALLESGVAIDQSGLESGSAVDKNESESGSSMEHSGSASSMEQSQLESGSTIKNVSESGSSMEHSGSGSSMQHSGSGSAIEQSGSGLLGSSMDILSGSGSGSGIEPLPFEPPGPKCIPTSRSSPGPFEPTFSATWQPLSGNISLLQAVLLSSNGQKNRIRFVPNKDFNGEVAFTFVAWDTTDGSADGSVRDASSLSAIDSFSSEAATIDIIVVPVNDAPLLPNNSFLSLTSILEDDIFSSGDGIGDLTDIVTDIDKFDTSFGIAIVEAEEENGQWQVTTDGGLSWTTVVNVCPYNATVLKSKPSGMNRVRFVPNRDFNGEVSFVFLAWDLTSDLQSGQMKVDITSADTVIGPYSVNSATVTITVEPVNDSPVLSVGSHLQAVVEDTPVGENNGTLVADIVRGYYLDVDVGSETGIAVVGVDLRYGIWQYWCPHVSWTTFIGNLLYGMYVVPPYPQVDRATLLSGDCRVRFLPEPQFNTLRDINGYLRPTSDTPYINIRAWDNTGLSEGLSGQYGVDTTYNTDSITNEFSSETEAATIQIISANDVPVIQISEDGEGIDFQVSFSENQQYVRLVEPDAVSITDIDHSELESVTISVTNTIDGAAEIIRLELLNTSVPLSIDDTTNTASISVNGSTELVMLSYNTFTHNTSSLTLSAPVGGQRVSIEAYEELLRHVVYTNTLEEPSNETRIVRFYVNDSEDVNARANTLVHIELFNEHTPVVNDSLDSIDFAEDTLVPISIASDDLIVADTDHNEYFYILNATITIAPTPEFENENVSVNLSSIQSQFNLTQEYDPLMGILKIMGDAPPMIYQLVLQTATYMNTIEETRPGVRNITFQVYDGKFYSNEHTVQVNMLLQNDQNPAITTANETFVFVEHSPPLSLSENLTITDADSGDEFQIISNITINITNLYDGVEEELNVTPYGNVSVQFEGTALILFGPSHISEFQQTLSSLTYTNLAEEPTTNVRSISIQANDGIFESQREYISVIIELVNDLTVIDLNGPLLPGSSNAVNYVEGLGEVLLAPNITLMDNDHQSLKMFTVRIVNAPDGSSEVLSITYYDENITNASMANLTTAEQFNITVEYDNSSNILILSGNSSLYNYQTLLQTVTYDNYEAMPGFPNTDPRMIEFIAYDSTDYSMPTLAYVTFHSVNDSPIVDLNGAVEGQHSVEFIEEGEPVLIAGPDLVLVDVDNMFLEYVRVTITNVLDGNYEVLTVNSSFTDEMLYTTYQAGILTITRLGLVENFRAALASVTYQNLADEPNYEPRILTVVANDGEQDSIPQYVTVNMTAVNDPPRLFITGIFNPPPATPPPTEAPTSSGSGDIGSGDIGSGDLGSGDLGSGGSGLGGLGSGSSGDIRSGSGVDIMSPVSGSGDLSSSGNVSGSGMTPDPQSGSGYDQASSSGDQSGTSSGMGSGSTDTSSSGMRLRRQSDLDNSDYDAMLDSGLDSDLFYDVESSPEFYSIKYIENSLPLSIVNQSAVLVEDDDDITLVRLEIILNGILDPESETIFFDINLLSSDLVSKFGEAGYITEGYIGDGKTCPPGLPFSNGVQASLDVSIVLTLTKWEDVIRSLKYCHSDEHPTAGTRNVTFRIQDSSEAWSNVPITWIEVVPENDAPVCDTSLSSTFRIDEDENVTIPALSICFDFEEELTHSSVVIRTPPRLGSATVQSSGDILYSPTANVYGNDSFTFVVCDNETGCSPLQNISIFIASVNDRPYAEESLTLILTEDVRELVDLSQFFGDYEDDLVPNSTFPEVRTVNEFDIGSVNRNSSTAFYFEPSINFEGIGIIRLNVCDSETLCISILLQVVVLPVNDVPIFETPTGGSPALRTEEDMPLRIEFSVFDFEDRVELNVTIVSTQNGTATTDRSNISFVTVTSPGVLDIFKQTMHIIYSPNFNFYGTDYVVIAAIDSEGGYNETTIAVEVVYINDPPEFTLTQLTVLEDEVTVFPLPSTLSITDPEEVLNAGSFSVLRQPSLGHVTYTFNETHFNVTGEFPDVGYLTYHPPEHYFTSENETITFILQACDADSVMTSLCTNSTIHITIISDNDAPHLPRVTQSVSEDGFLTFNLSDYTFDVEDGKPSLDNIFLTDPYPKRGVAVYDNTTGFLSYTPFLNNFGEDIVHYNACDSENHCSTIKGQVVVNILEVNDPPVAEDFLHFAIEDDFDLIGFEEHFNDNETGILGLRLGIRSDDYAEIGHYIDEWITPVGASLRVYHAHQIITYEPPFEFVGTDRFTYSVCDLCDSRRDDELGRVDQEGHCARQIEENGGSHLFQGSDIYITCSEAQVTVRTINENDVPQARDISGTTQTRQSFIFTPFDDSMVMLPPDIGTGYLYSNIDAAVFDYDDLQALNALQNGYNLTLFNLESVTDINETSLVLKSQPTNGVASMLTVNGRIQIEYTPNDDFRGGYDEFVYEVCDRQREDAPPRCAEAVARAFVTREGPKITSVTAHSFMQEQLMDSDSQVSAGDVVTVSFSEDTNMPPFGNTERTLSMFDVDQIFEFAEPFILEEISPNGYTARWDTPTQISITLVDVGYPQPFVMDTDTRMYRELKVGEWTVSLRPHPGPCGGFIDDQPVTVDQYCLLSADETAQPVDFTSPPLAGNFGLRMPELQTVLLESISVDGISLESNQVEDVFLQTHIILRLVEPLSYAQLQLYCSSDPNDILDTNLLAESITLIVDGCANILPDGSNGDQIYADNLQLITEAFSANEQKRSVEEKSREKRQISTIPPVQSEIVLQIVSIDNPTINPATHPSRFYSLVASSLNYETIAEVISQTMGIPVSALIGFKNTAEPLVGPGTSCFYYSFDDDLTPEIVNVVADDPDDLDQNYGSGDTLTISFNVDTDQPAVGQKAELDRIFVFDPPLGIDYVGEWLDAKTLQITIIEIDATTTNYPSATSPGPVHFSLSFRSNYLCSGEPALVDNEEIPISTPWCIGVNVCGSNTTDDSDLRSVGICDTTQRSCRAHETWTSLEGDFGTGTPEPKPPFPWWWILVAIIIVLIIAVLVVVFYIMWRNYSQRAHAKEARRVLSRWKEDRFAPGKDERRKDDVPKTWQGPPAPASMRPPPDPFATKGAVGKLPEVVPRPPTAYTEVEKLPPVPQHRRSSFIPRTPARIHPAPPALQSLPAAPRSRTLSSPASLPQQLGLPPLTKLPTQPATPSRADNRSVLPPVKGGLISHQARRALSQGPDNFGSAAAAMPDRPARLPPLGANLFGPTHMPDKPLHLPPIQQPEIGKGKAPVGVKLLPKKGTPQSPQEDVFAEDTDSGKPSALMSPTLSPPLRMTRPLPTIGKRQSLPQLGAMPRAFPPIGIRSPPPTITASGMPRRSIGPDPFTTGLNTSLGGLASPARMTPAPLQPVRLPSIRPTLSPTQSPTKVTTVGPASPASSPPAPAAAAAQPPEEVAPQSKDEAEKTPTGEQN